jgi:hypothetical protein
MDCKPLALELPYETGDNQTWRTVLRSAGALEHKVPSGE